MAVHIVPGMHCPDLLITTDEERDPFREAEQGNRDAIVLDDRAAAIADEGIREIQAFCECVAFLLTIIRYADDIDIGFFQFVVEPAKLAGFQRSARGERLREKEDGDVAPGEQLMQTAVADLEVRSMITGFEHD